ncbi:Putative tyrosinase copper-binding domain, di-copper centre-containing domain superfamily [Septoria linicola]|uniref:Tyrosinase copper-binding domain, di-copper centre-containing domain superfamily n=1 Tax=Septoria linicola TaxID=215465 RepID=A0A9Q9EMM3_9PEZI|nr:Putative tyrosinase copper-binding domain, di-copper centre-containing domain superfamily [Septoria linicola]
MIVRKEWYSTPAVHRSPWLLAWHRHFLWVFERTLRDECGYTGGQPYWDYSRYYGQPIESWPIFDGSDTSLGGNGKADTPSKDCSCLTDGPFADWKINLGPVAGNHACTDNPQDDGLGLNTRCLERKFEPKFLGNLTYDNVTFTINNFEDPDAFGVRIESWPVGIHPIPHIFVGGTNSDVPGAPGDPWFMCHHTMLDRVWAIWQSIDLEVRTTQLAKADSYADLRKRSRSPPAPAISMDDDITLSPIFDKVKVRDVMSPTGGQYCYRHDSYPDVSAAVIGQPERAKQPASDGKEDSQAEKSGPDDGDGARVAAPVALEEEVSPRQTESTSQPATAASVAAWKPVMWADSPPISLSIVAMVLMAI